MKYIIIGLGNYGHVLAEELSALGHEIIGADISESRVDSIKDKVATAFIIDATDEQSLSVLPLNSVDIVIVAIGENFGASIRVVALLKQKKVPRIFARAIDAVHKAVLEAFDLERILDSGRSAARSLVQLLDFGTNMEGFRIDQDYYVVKFTVPKKFVGYFVNELKFGNLGICRNKPVHLLLPLSHSPVIHSSHEVQLEKYPGNWLSYLPVSSLSFLNETLHPDLTHSQNTLQISSDFQ